MITHKIIQFINDGSDVIEIDEIKLQNPDDDEVRFKVTAFAINRADLLFINRHHLNFTSISL